MSGIADLRSRIVVREVRTPRYFGDAFNAWQNTALGMSHTLRQTALLRPSVKSKKVKNLYYVGGGTQPGIGVPMCLISAQLVYKYLARDWSTGAPQAIKKVTI
jgi:phytoene dehydrogenase-like protein